MKRLFKISIYIVMIIVITVLLIYVKKKQNLIQTSTINIKEEKFSKINNQKIEWGIKREKDHKQPDVGTKNINILNKYEGYYLGNKEKPCVYLTFDNGYEAGYTEKILEVLKQNEVTATFFLTEHYINSADELVKKMIEEGHIIGNHTCNHKSLPSLSETKVIEEVMNLHTLVHEKFNYEMKFTRPPKGEYSEKTIAITNSLGYKTVMWSVAYDDWDENRQGREEYGTQKILENIHNGAIILLHGTSKDNSNILDYCIKEIKNMGYEIKSLEQFEY